MVLLLLRPAVASVIASVLIASLSTVVVADDKTRAHTGVASTAPGIEFRSGATYRSVYDDNVRRAVTRIATWVQDKALGMAVARRLDEQAPHDKKALEDSPGAGILYEVRVDRGLELERGLRSVGYLAMGSNPVDVLAKAMTTKYIANAPLSPFPDLERSGYIWVTLGSDGVLRYAQFVGPLGAALQDAAWRVIAAVAVSGWSEPVRIEVTPTKEQPRPSEEPKATTPAPPPPPPPPPVVLPAPKSVERPHPGADGSRDRPRPEREAKTEPRKEPAAAPKEPARDQKREPARDQRKEIIRGPLGVSEKDGDLPSEAASRRGTAGTVFKVRESKPAPTPELRWMVMDGGGRIIGYFSQQRDAQLVADTLAAAAKSTPTAPK